MCVCVCVCVGGGAETQCVGLQVKAVRKAAYYMLNYVMIVALLTGTS